MAIVRQLMIRAGADFSAMRQEMQKASNDLKSFKAGVGRAMVGIGTALASIGGVMGLNSAINDAIKFEALMGTLSSTLGSSMKDFIDWQQTVGDTMGFSKLQVAEMANDHSLRLKEIATSEQDLFDKTKALINAAAIIRSKKGMDMVEISDRMRSAMNGEADGADELGVNVRASAIMQSNAYKMLANGEPWSELSSKMQKTILYQHILDSTTRNFGTTVANNTALLKGNFVAALGDVKLALGQAFLPILNIALPLLTRLARAAETAFLYVAAFMRALFPKANIAAGAATTSVINNQSAAVGGLGDAYKGAGKEATKAGKAAKKAAGSVAGFDEVNTLTQPSADSGDDADAAGAGAGADMIGGVPGIDMGGFEKSLEVSDKIQDMVKKMKKAFSDLAGDGNIKKLSDAFSNMKQSFKDLGTAISNFVDNPTVQAVGQWIAKTLGGNFMRARISDIQLLSGAFESWAGSIEMLDGLLALDFDKFFGGFEKWGKGVSESVEGFIRIFSSSWADKFGNFRAKFGEVWSGMRDDIKKYGDPMKMEVSDFGKYIKDTLLTKWTEIKTASAVGWEATKTVLSTKWTEIKAKADEKFAQVKDAIAVSWGGIKVLASTKWDEIRNVVSGRWETFKTAISWDSLRVLVSNTWTGIKNNAVTKWDEIKQAVSGKWNEITKIDLSGITTAVGGIWNDLKIMTKNTWDGIGQVVKGSVNSVIDTINKFIDQVNRMEIKIPKVKVGNIEVGGGTIGMPNIPKIPRLARGGIVDGETNMGNYVAGEAGPEMIVPLENTSFTDKIASALGTAVMTAMTISQGNNKGGNTVINIDGREVARALQSHNANETKRLGSSMIQVF